MKIVKILGGLGNQMFQYSFYKSLLERFDSVKADLSEFKNYRLHNSYEINRVFKLRVEKSDYLSNFLIGGANRDLISRIAKKLVGFRPSYYEQPNSTVFDPEIYNNEGSCYLDGYWQNEKYFKNIEQQIRKDFTFPMLEDYKNQQLLDVIRQQMSVGIHVRRGDYINHPLLGNICTEEYYKLAISYFTKRYDRLNFIVFSNDQKWCKDNLSIEGNSTYVDWNHKGDSFKDMQLMSCCNHNIIANSSFSWWGAWLNNDPDKIVITPKVWFNPPGDLTAEISNDLIPKSWIKI